MQPPRRLCAAILATALLLGACGDDGDVAEERSDQVRAAAVEAGLPDDVADVLALAAEGATATYQVTYSGSDGASIVVSQSPPDRRVDVLTAGLIVESKVVRGGVAYECTLPDDGRPGDPLSCERTSGEVESTGSFTAEALDTFIDELAAALDDVDLSVDERTIADTVATCLISAPKAGTSLDGSGESVDTICLAPDGAQLLVDVGGERVVADAYAPEVPKGTFDT